MKFWNAVAAKPLKPACRRQFFKDVTDESMQKSKITIR